MATTSQHELYAQCIRKQLDEVDMLSAIYCSPGEIHIFDPSVISDFNEFLKNAESGNDISTAELTAHLDFTITLKMLFGTTLEKLEVRIEMPHLYPLLENAIIVIHSALIGKAKENYFKAQIENYISTIEKTDGYIYQVVTWIQDQVGELIKRDISQFKNSENSKWSDDTPIEFERLWIYSHHIKSKFKRQEILRNARYYELSGFSRPGKPGIICVEGVSDNVQEFWRVIKSMQWHKIAIAKSEVQNKTYGDMYRLRRFDGFREQLFCDNPENKESVMNMGLFIKFLEDHNSGYMKKELFGL